MNANTSRLHAALIWAGEPIGDVVLADPRPITIGPAAGTTFTVPDLGLPEKFSIVRPGKRGYVLTVGGDMRGTLSIGGARTTVEALVGEAPFAATAIAPGDWGVIDLDGNGSLQLFFQLAGAPETVGRKRGFDIDTVMPAAAFSVLLHLCFLVVSFGLDTAESGYVWPGPRSLTGRYLVTRIEPQKPAQAPIIAVQPPADRREEPAQPQKQEKAPRPEPPAKEGESSKAPERDLERGVPAVGALAPQNRREIEKVIKIGKAVDLDKFLRTGPGLGRKGAGRGDVLGAIDGPPGARGGGDGDREVEREGTIDVKKGAHKEPKRGTGDGDGDGTGEIILDRPKGFDLSSDTLSKDEIDRTIRQRQNAFRACHQKAINHASRIVTGKVTARFTIAPNGSVASVAIEEDTLGNEALSKCIARTLRTLVTFRATSGSSVVRYPFLFFGGR